MGKYGLNDMLLPQRARENGPCVSRRTRRDYSDISLGYVQRLLEYCLGWKVVPHFSLAFFPPSNTIASYIVS